MRNQSYFSYYQKYSYFLKQIKKSSQNEQEKIVYSEKKKKKMEETSQFLEKYSQTKLRSKRITQLELEIREKNEELSKNKISIEEIRKLLDQKEAKIQYYERNLELLMTMYNKSERECQEKK